jgi:D-methionine transport system permease protein
MGGLGGLFFKGLMETLYMVLVSTAVSYIIGLPIGVILNITDKNGICKNVPVNRVLGFVVNFLRSVPFIILLVTVLPLTRLIVGTTIGSTATIVPLVISAAPFVSRMVESSLQEVDAGVIEAAEAMGTSTFKIIYKVLIPEAKPALIVGAVISTVTILSYSAMASTIAGGGLGAIAIVWGHQRSNPEITWICVILIVLIVQAIQEIGMRIATKIDKRIK